MPGNDEDENRELEALGRERSQGILVEMRSASVLRASSSAAYSARQVRQDLAASGQEVARIIDGAWARRRSPAQSRRAQPTAGIGYIA